MKNFRWSLTKKEFNIWRTTIQNCFESYQETDKNEKAELLKFLVNEKVAPFYYLKCKERIEDKELKNTLKSSYFHFLAANIIYREKVKNIIRLLNSVGVVPLILKGIDLQDNLYEKPEMRPSSDLDLLILDEEDYKKALEMIFSLGYQLYLYRSPKYPFMFSKDVVLMPSRNDGLMIELHHGLRFGKFDKRRQYDEIFYQKDNLILYDKGDIKYFGLDKEALYVYLSYHTFVSHQDCNRLMWIFDLILLKDKVDEKKQMELASKSDMEETLKESQKVLEDLLRKQIAAPCQFVREKEILNYDILKLADEFINIRGIAKKIVWLSIWFFPKKEFLKKRYGEDKCLTRLYIFYYVRFLKRLFETAKGILYE